MQRPPRPRRRFIAGLAMAWLVALAAGAALAPATFATSTTYSANCDVKLRGAPSVSATVLTTIPTASLVVSSGTVAGDAWSATCGTSVSGSTWLAISSVGGTSVLSLYGVATVYAASGLFSAVAAPTTWLEGIDVSRWQGAIDYGQVAAAGKAFVIAKTSEGIGFTDPNWAANLAHATAAGLKVTGYHFARPDGNPTKPIEEADWFVSQLKLAPGMIVPALDLERAGMSQTALIAWVGAWLNEVYLKTGVRPMIYTSPSFWHTYLNNTTTFADQGYSILWIAHWGVTKPSVPANNWSGHGWTFWQYDDCGKVPGIGGCVDVDRFNGLDLTRVTVGADFNVTAGPTKQSVEQGAGTQFAVSIDRTYFTLPITLTVTGLPAGISATLDPSAADGSQATLSIDTGTSAPAAGTYPLSVTGKANGVTRTTTATLVVTDAAPPTVSVPTPRLYAHSTLSTSAAPVRTTWTATDASGVIGDELQRSVSGGSWTDVGLAPVTATSITQTLTVGTKYGYQVRASDGAGNTSNWAMSSTVTPLLDQQSSSRVTYGGTWHSTSASTYSGGSLKYATARGAWAKFTFVGSSVAWVASTGPTRGSADVYVDGVFKGTISLHSTSYHARQLVFAYSWATNGSHSLKIVTRATSGHPRVDVDAFVRLYQG